MPKSRQEAILDFRHAFAEGFHALGIDVSAQQIAQLCSHLSLLLRWNAKVNLTAVRDPSSIVRLHFLDSAAAIRFLSPYGCLLDVGSGAGFPGLPIKVLAPEKEVVLLESQRRKANFLREAVRQLNLQNTRIVEGRLEKIATQGAVGTYNEIITRAFGSVAAFLSLTFPLLAPGGKSIVMHGPRGRDIFPGLDYQAKKIGFAENRIQVYSLPKGGEQRSALIFSKD